MTGVGPSLRIKLPKPYLWLPAGKLLFLFISGYTYVIHDELRVLFIGLVLLSIGWAKILAV
jgi:hypothetical protein